MQRGLIPNTEWWHSDAWRNSINCLKYELVSGNRLFLYSEIEMIIAHQLREMQLTCCMGLNMQSLESCIAMDVKVEVDDFVIVQCWYKCREEALVVDRLVRMDVSIEWDQGCCLLVTPVRKYGTFMNHAAGENRFFSMVLIILPPLSRFQTCERVETIPEWVSSEQVQKTNFKNGINRQRCSRGLSRLPKKS